MSQRIPGQPGQPSKTCPHKRRKGRARGKKRKERGSRRAEIRHREERGEKGEKTGRGLLCGSLASYPSCFQKGVGPVRAGSVWVRKESEKLGPRARWRGMGTAQAALSDFLLCPRHWDPYFFPNTITGDKGRGEKHPRG